MWWDNDDWAARHISKHKVTVNEAWEVVFENKSVFPLVAPDQLRFPPFRRYWTINLTKKVEGSWWFGNNTAPLRI
jgi:hypothetical protein